MRRRQMLFAFGAASLPLIGTGVLFWRDERARLDAEAKTPPPKVETDLAPVKKYLPQLGPIVSAHWLTGSSAIPGDRLPIGPTDDFFDAFVQLGPGQVGRLLAGRATEPAPHMQVVSLLEPFRPAGGSWERSDTLDSTLLRAESSLLYFDRGSDLVYVSAVNLGDPNAPYVHVDQNGTQTTVTPSPIPIQP